MNWGLPASVEIGGVSYEIRTDFRVILDIFVMLSDPDLSGTDRAEGILQMFYVSPEDIPPQHLQEAVDRFTWFQNGGKEQIAEVCRLGAGLSFDSPSHQPSIRTRYPRNPL